MNKRLLTVFCTTVCLISALSFSAFANEFNEADLEAGCEGYVITGSAALLAREHDITYLLTITHSDSTTSTVGDTYHISLSSSSHDNPFTFSGEVPCDAVAIDGEVTLSSNGDLEETVTFDELPLDCTCDEDPCDPRTQGYWKRICDGLYGPKKLHPETPGNVDKSLCIPLQMRGRHRNDPCARAKAQYSALQLNINNDGYLSPGCEVDIKGYSTVKDVADAVGSMIPGNCKAAADLAESINSGDAL